MGRKPESKQKTPQTPTTSLRILEPRGRCRSWWMPRRLGYGCPPEATRSLHAPSLVLYTQGSLWSPTGASVEANSFQVIPWQHFKAHGEGAPATKTLKNFTTALLRVQNKPNANSILKGFTEELEGSVFQQLKGQGCGKNILGEPKKRVAGKSNTLLPVVRDPERAAHTSTATPALSPEPILQL